ncbi:UBP-type zinc finger domain-containing protein [Streptomyces venezuelae]
MDQADDDAQADRHRDAPRPSWAVAPDGGRPEGGRSCAHATTLPSAPDQPAESCAECLASGSSWRRLLWCATCGHVGCCDSSPGRHAYRHHDRTGHPVVLTLSADEGWAWCYEDEVYLVQ